MANNQNVLYVLAKSKKTVLNSSWWYNNKKQAKEELKNALDTNYCSGYFKGFKVYRITKDNRITEVK